VPALFTIRRGSSSPLAGGVRAQVGSGSRRVRRALVAAEIALAVVLLAGAGLLLRSYLLLRQVNPGFEPAQVITFQLSLPSSVYPDGASAAAFAARLSDRLRSLPAIDVSAPAMGVPFAADTGMFTAFAIAGQPDPAPPARQTASLRVAGTGYFTALSIPIRRGRAFDARDTGDSLEVAIVSERLARRRFGDRDPIGRQLIVSISPARGARNGPKTIVGVAGDVKGSALDQEQAEDIYLPYAQQPVSGMTVVARSAADPRLLAADLRHAVAAIDPTLPLANLRPLADLVDASVATRRFAMLLVVLFAAVALMLAAVGLYGVLAQLVAARTSEVGLRLALGATASAVMWLFVREALWLTLAGLAAGLAGAAAGAQLIASALFGVTPSDPATLASVAVTLGAVATAAIAVPAWRATRIDPAALLRTDA
jgi:putative ABC transport system permease protein